ncbi:DNA mismatch repair endonuclease MutL [Vibrio mexicanus]|uniref:DNA mismatch repair endonuclease MutL n=1 Tax=Vibrio mexicanus TaxID=1004326 RepID=UPI00063C43C9|nr:DNA mismatch repair endonuclease MutL [Vibrio mexicanus]
MTIKILPARLANQIAAGEVVERPASVVKELVENSLDSGATKIDVEIEKGGAKLIRVRDNGKGIVKDELGLALSRHATSKIHTLDDLEAIISLGFRGEALASISSVSRLTITSRTATQSEAWSAYSEGRDMQVKLQPAAHPIGTTVEVLDLFFNTPARRKFLRTEKTEFTHIDELLKRIALSRFDVTLNLRHNGKVIRQYRAAKNDIQAEKRIAAVCGNPFVRNMLKIELEHQGLKLHGWITTPEGARQQSDLQYCYVNGRMMRDKLINHAIRQSYETSLRPDQFATYVLFIELDPHQVDVNVHPAKHEVRFHQARLVHDFIYQALSDALSQTRHLEAQPVNESAFYRETEHENSERESSENQSDLTPSQMSVQVLPPQTTSSAVESESVVPERVFQAIENTPDYPGRAGFESQRESHHIADSAPSQRSDWVNQAPAAKSPSGNGRTQAKDAIRKDSPSKQELAAYQELMKTPDFETETTASKPLNTESVVTSPSKPVVITQLGKAISVVDSRYLVMGSKEGVALVSLERAQWYRVRGQLSCSTEPLKAQPLLVPLSMKISADLVDLSAQYQTSFERLGIQLKARGSNNLMVMGVPAPLRQQNIQQIVSDLLSYLASSQANEQLSVEQMSDWLADHVTEAKPDYTLSEAIQIIAELEMLWQGQLPLDDRRFVTSVDFSSTINQLLVN